MLALMASFLEPQMKGGISFSPADQDAICLMIRDEMRLIAVDGAAFEDEVAERNLMKLINIFLISNSYKIQSKRIEI